MGERGAAPGAGELASGAGGQSHQRNGQGRHRVGRLSSPTLIGRERELRLLLESALSPPALILVEGEAGVGKSRLVSEALADPAFRETRVLLGNCHRLREPFLLGPVVEALRSAGLDPPARALNPVAGALRPLLPELANVLPPEPPPIDDPRAQRHRIFRALLELIGAFSPTVCVFEDLHWADEGTLEFLAFLLSQPPAGLSLVVTYRSEDLPPSSPLAALPGCLAREALEARIELQPLSIDEVTRLVCALLETSSVSDELAKHLHDQTAGIPFALEEVVRLLRDRDQLKLVDGWQTAELGQLEVPPALRESMRERTASLTSDAQLMTRAAAVLSLPASQDLIAAVAGLSPARAAKALTRALRAAVLEEGVAGLYGFRHALAAQAVYGEIPGPERRLLHTRAARSLEAGKEPQPLAQLAHHFKAADRPRRWAHYAEAAAEAASAVGDDRAAARLLEEGLGTPGLSRAARVRMAVNLGRAATYSVYPETAVPLLQRVLDEQPMAVGARGELRFCIARLRYQTGDEGSWRKEMARAVDELATRPELAARAMVTLAWPLVGQGDIADDLAWLDRAVLTAAETDDPVARTAVRAQRAAILLFVGDPEGWTALEDVPREGSSVDETLQLLRGYHSLSVAALGLGHYRHAESFLAEVARLDDELDYVSWGPWRASARVSLDWRMGHWEGLEQRLRELSEGMPGAPLLAVGNEVVLSFLLLSQARVEEAERSFASILERAGARGWMSARVAAAAGLAKIRLDRGEAGAAAEAAGGGLDVLRRKGIWIWGKEVVPVAVQALLADGRRAEAGALAKRFAAGVRGRDAPAARAARSFASACVAEAEGRHEKAASLFGDADRTWAELPAPYEAAGAREAQARCLLAEGERRGADLLLGALKTFEGLGAIRDARRTRAALKAEEIPLPSESRGGRRAYGDELSPREAEIAQLAGMGRKNREIAEMLFISQRTVETHVAAALRKLEAESREDLAGALNELSDGESSVAQVKNR